MALEDRGEPGVDRLRERERLLRCERHAARLLRDDRRRAGCQRRHHLLGRRHLRERSHLERELPRLVARGEVVVGELAARSRGPAETSQRAVPRIGSFS